MSSLASDPRLLRSTTATGVTAAVIEEARRRQRRRRRFGALAAVALGVLAGVVLLGPTKLTSTSHTTIATNGRPVSSQHPSITLYLTNDTSPAAIRNTIAAATREPGVARVTFISKNAALRVMKHRYPALVGNLTVNPFTASIEIRVAAGADPSGVISVLGQLRTVEHIRYRTSNG
jgi:cell division protein FtsX